MSHVQRLEEELWSQQQQFAEFATVVRLELEQLRANLPERIQAPEVQETSPSSDRSGPRQPDATANAVLRSVYSAIVERP